MEELKAREQAVLEYISSQIKRNGYPPTVRDICAALNFKSTSTVQKSLDTLEELGYIRKQPGKRRVIEIVDAGSRGEAEGQMDPGSGSPERYERQDIVDIPIIGRVAAGTPILSEQNIEGSFPVPAQFAAGGTSFMLSVHGNSMIEAGILDGDYILVQEQKTAYNGQTVVAMIEGDFDYEATVKEFYKENGHIRLQPRNSSMDPIIVDKCEIVGIVKGVFRYMN